MAPNALETAQQTLLVLLPEVFLLLTAVVVFTSGAFVSLPRRAWSITSAVALLIAFVILLATKNQATDIYSAVTVNDAMSFYSRAFLIFAGLILLALAHDQVDAGRAPEFFAALLTIQAGSMVVATANEIVFLFAGLELVSIPTYLLLYLSKRNSTTQEAATKYFYLSIFSSGLLLFGLAYLYGMTGISNLKALAFLAQSTPSLPDVPHPLLGLIAVVFVMAGLGFRVAAVPFHFYAPDVYQGSPTVIAAMLAWVPKAVGFVAILRTLTAVIPTGDAHQTLTDNAVLLAWIIAVATMTLGNTVALAQNDLKRLFAYSSIAHAGYLMIGVAVAFKNGQDVGKFALGSESILYYLAAYAVMTLGAFGVILALNTGDRPVETVDDMAGLGADQPMLSLAMMLCLLSLAGIPPLAGFMGKFGLLSSALAVATGEDAKLFRWLAFLGAVNSAIGAYYYLRIVVAMYLRKRLGGPVTVNVPWPTKLAVATCAALTVLLGIAAAPVQLATRESAVALVAHPAPGAAPSVANR